MSIKLDVDIYENVSFQSMKDDVLALGSQIDYIDGVIQDLDEGDGLAPQNKVIELEKTRTRQADILQQLNDLLQDMEAGTQIVDEYRVGAEHER